MEITYFIFFIGCLLIIYWFQSRKKTYSKISISILANYFGEKNFTQNKTALELSDKLEIEEEWISLQNKSIKKILNDAKHKSDIMYKHKISINKPYTDLTTFKIVANCVIDHCVKKDINIKDSIKLLFLTFQNPYFEEILNMAKTEEEIIDNFYDLLEGFIERYKKAL